ncbi:MAG: SUMF1/EgtB/PvdO family nonheme iron enzyme [Terracidiphilus sp.]
MKATIQSIQQAAGLLLLAATATTLVCAQDTHYAPTGQQIPPPTCLTLRGAWEGGYIPCTALSHKQWLADITHWRAERRIRIGYDTARYEMPALKWTQSSFIQPQMMVHDRYFYDPVAGKYTVDRYLDDLDKRYGGIDAVLIWATYPNMGIDDRNQQDMVRSMPGGIEGLKQMVADFHRRGVRVLFPMMMWDQGTRDPGASWPDAIADFMKQINADGINGDTQDGVPLAFSLAADKVGHPLAFEPEGGPSDEALAWDVMTWGQYKFQFVPTVDRYRWLEPRHEVNIQGRWNRDKTDDLQFAFFNGEGWESWESVWGIWNGIIPRDGEATRRVATIERAVAPFLVSQGWEPFYPMQLYGVFTSRWPLGNQTVWTIVNRNEYDVKGRQMTVPYKEGMRYFDLYHGVELHPAREGDESVLSFTTEAHGYGAILATPDEPDAGIQALMAKMKAMTEKPLASYSHQWEPLTQQMVEIQPSKASSTAPEGMIRIEGSKFLFKVQGIEIEGGDDVGVDVQYPWEDTPRRFHGHIVDIKPFYIDKYPVTNAEFKKFLDASHYHPKDDLNFLKDWKGGTYPEGWANKPVTWVSLEDARAYAEWAGKRLPHEWEWQYAAQGSDGRRFPWGNCDWLAPALSGGPLACPWEDDPKNAPAPIPDKGRVMLAASDVDAHPKGASPFGVMDMVGNVWQWTDEYVDEHTRGAILRGGSHYQPQGSIWYFPQAYKNDQHGKLLLMAPSYDRSGAVGFRCVKDADPFG